jgi:hypothetical protein
MPQVLDQGSWKQPWDHVWECGFCHRKLKFSQEEIKQAEGNYFKSPDETDEKDWRYSPANWMYPQKMIGYCETCERSRQFEVERNEDDE